MIERIVNAERMEQLIEAFGSFDENIKRIESAFGVHVVNRGTELKVQGDEEAVDKGVRAVEGLLSLSAKGETIDEQKVRYLVDLVKSGNDDKIGDLAQDVVCVTAKGKPIKAKTLGQQKYLKAIARNTITIGVGPAGTGKTYLAVAQAVAQVLPVRLFPPRKVYFPYFQNLLFSLPSLYSYLLQVYFPLYLLPQLNLSVVFRQHLFLQLSSIPI